ncbi:MAG TPA: extracellular solute-binding protein [Micropepsaceae bacterium]|jgi:iron(III) transport system substrate-binding protein|nr:extracellular solute-binding protein [Micropepsaceae bacterium]
MRLTLTLAVLALGITALAGPAAAVDALNIYSARHYDSDELLYDGFQKATGIPVNVIEGDGPELLARMKAEGKNSPADVFLTVDAGNLWLAEKENLFQPAQSKILEARIPASLKSPKNLWFGFSTRARLIFVNAKKVDPRSVQTYDSLADPRLKGKICMRSSSAVYNLSLLGAMIAHMGPAKAEQWVRGVVANFARPPQGADTTLLQSVAAGECGVTIANHYYYMRLVNSKVKGERDAAKKLTPIFPDQDGYGTHVNVSGGGVMASAPHKAIAVKFLEFMASDAAQNIIAGANYEFPAVASVPITPELKTLGKFKTDPLNVSFYGQNQAQAQTIFDRAGWR